MKYFAWVSLGFAALALACGGDAQVMCDGADCETGGNGGSGNSGTGANGGSGGSGAAGGSGGGKVCGGMAELACGAGEWCDYDPSYCGGDDSQGICRPRPNACDDIYAPVCGCDGNVYSNACDAERSGVDQNLFGGCTPPGGMFGCGAQFCDLVSQYCEIGISDVGGEPNTYVCEPLPNTCGNTPDCVCLANEPCGFMCEGDAASGLTLTCPGG